MEALHALDDPKRWPRSPELQQQWREARTSRAPRPTQLWRRFKTAHDEVWVRCGGVLRAEAESRAQNLARKSALCEKAEALAASTNWMQTADEIKPLQAEWKTIGPCRAGARRRSGTGSARPAIGSSPVATRSRRAKGMWAENLPKKERCASAEALASQPTGSRSRRRSGLQAEWKTIGPVKKSRPKRSGSAFVKRAIASSRATRSATTSPAPSVSPPAKRFAPSSKRSGRPTPEPAADLLAAVRALRAACSRRSPRAVSISTGPCDQRAFRGGVRRAARALARRDSRTDLDPDANRDRMESLVPHVEDLATSLAVRWPLSRATRRCRRRLAWPRC